MKEASCIVATLTRERTKPAAGSRLLGLVVRLLLILAAFELLSLAQHAFATRNRASALDFTFHLGLWARGIGLDVLSGLAFGLAAFVTRGRLSYRWGRVLLLGIVPLVMLAHFAFLFGFAAPHHWKSPAWLLQTRFYFGPQDALAVLLGIALASGVSSQRG